MIVLEVVEEEEATQDIAEGGMGEGEEMVGPTVVSIVVVDSIEIIIMTLSRGSTGTSESRIQLLQIWGWHCY